MLPAKSAKGKNGKPGARPSTDETSPATKQRARVVSELIKNGLLGRSARSAFGNKQAGGKRNNERRDLRHQAIANRKLHEHVGRCGQRHVMPQHADDDAAENIDRRDDHARDGVAAHELRRAVHRTEEGAFLFEFTAASGRLFLVNSACGQIRVDGHLFAWDGVERKSGADFSYSGCAFGDDKKIDRNKDQEHDDADNEVSAHDEVGEARDHVTCRGNALRAIR